MTERRLAPPGGDDAPATALLDDGDELNLAALARHTCRRYRSEFADERERYGDAGHAWCVHDNQYLLHWAAEAVNGYVDMRREVAWLASVLESRGFPLDRLARNLDLAAEVVLHEVGAQRATGLAGVLTDAAKFVRSRHTFLD